MAPIAEFAKSPGARLPAILAALAVVSPLSAAAQRQAGEGFAIEEIIVTAQRRETRLQDTPIAVTALSGEDLTERMAGNLEDVGNFVPNLDFSSATQSSRSSFVSAVFIRGVGQTDFIVTTDPGVGIYVDGIYYGRTTGGVVDMLDIERVEVLRGPQGTLFGKNTIGGALNVVSAKPDDSLHGRAELTYGEYDRVRFRGDLNIPIADKLYGRVAVSTRHSDGYGKRVDFATRETTDALGEDDSVSGRARFRWLATDRLEANLAFDYTRVREPQVPDDIKDINPAAPLLGLWNGLVGGPAGTPYTPAFLTASDYSNFATGPSTADLDLFGVSLTLDWQLGPFNVKSITAYRDMEALFSNDGDGSPLRILGSDRVDLDQDQLSQELHVFGTSFDDRLNWLAGVYYYEESAFEITNAYVLPGIFQALEAAPFLLGPFGPIGPCPPAPVVATLPSPGPLGCAGNPNNIPLDLDFHGTNDVEVTNYSIFGHGSFAFTDQWSVTGGIRYTYEEKTHDLFYMRVNSGFIIAPPGTRREDSWGAVTPKAGLEFRPTEDLMLYFSASRGFRSGGFNGRPFYPEAVVTFDPEYLWSYEGGIKSEWFERRLIANLAVFYNDYTDIQLTSNRATADGNVAIFTENGGEAEMKGVELELHARPVERLDLVAGIGYIDAELTAVNPGVTATLDTVLPKTPNWDLNFSAQYRWPLAAFGNLTGRVDYAYRSEYFNDVANNAGLVQDGFGLVNVRLAFEDHSETWQIAVFGTNLSDERYITGGVGGLAAIGLDEVQYGRPREWGVSLSYRF
ncbi:MAG: TonB-dependent receptor [Gammaproteobacteria bacterium]|nr:TonB-dependent receptor [Gammaproteobacteria bacterium]